ncbi:MAG: hypothetical protein MJ215_04890 [Spirochaetia bacterium]|nr:hypothetical protein [Spirochaetia bacterium]
MKKIILVLFAFLLTAGAFAQEVKSVGITDSDVKNFAKNFNAIAKEIDKLGDDDASKLESILEKYGISGPGRFQKFVMMMKCSEVAVFDKTMADDPETAKIMKSMGMDPMAKTRSLINQKDFDVVNANVDLLKDLIK